MFKTPLDREQALVEHSWLGLEDKDFDEVSNILAGRSEYDMENPHEHLVRLLRRPENFYLTCKYLLNKELHPLQVAIIQELWTHPFPMLIGARGMSKSFLLAVYATLKCVLVPKTKIIIAGAAFRQSKVIYEYMEDIWQNSAILRDICDSNSRCSRDIDRCTAFINDSCAIAIPIGNGEKIRGLRAHTIIADEINSINKEVFETVVQGFSSVSSNPIQNIKEMARMRKLKQLGKWTEGYEDAYGQRRTNQTILSGTAGYDFQNFAGYWKQYKKIIGSKGDKRKLAEIFNDEVSDNFNYKDFSIVRIPYELLPEGYLDEKTIMRAKATINSGVFNTEFGAVFSKDSDGFYRRTLIESCVGNEQKPVKTPSGEYVWFDPSTRGNPKMQYVLAIDPASESDNFAISILEMREDHRRLVYCWTTNRTSFKARQKEGLTNQHEYYGYCIRKIRDLMKMFNIVEIGIDSQGGGIAIEEGLHDPDKMDEGEKPIWLKIDPKKEKETDDQPGLHILEMINFADSKWTSEAHHGLKKDMEDHAIIFPRFDSLTISLAGEEDERMVRAGNTARKYDSLEDAVLEIEELKEEMSTIVMTQTKANQREHFDTPEVIIGTGKKRAIRKDRFSSLVIANMIARCMQRHIAEIVFDQSIGGLAGNIKNKTKSTKMYNGPEWFNPGGGTCFVVPRR